MAQGSPADLSAPVAAPGEELVLPITGMHCAGCAARIGRTLGKLDAVAEAEVSYATAEARVRSSAGASRAELRDTVVETIEKLGFAVPGRAPVEPDGDDALQRQDVRPPDETDAVVERVDAVAEAQARDVADVRRRLVVALLFGAPLFVLAMLADMTPWLSGLAHHTTLGGLRTLHLIELALATPVQLYAGWPFVRNAARNARLGTSDMDTLVALGTLAAFGYSVAATFAPGFFAGLGDGGHGAGPYVYYESAAVIIALVLLGRWLELRARGSTQLALRRLIGLRPAVALRVRWPGGGGGEEVDVASVRVGDHLRVRPGESVPVDGVVVDGRGVIDESMVTGEPVPVSREPGERVVGGTLNSASASFVMRATQVGDDTVLSRIIRLVRRAQASRAPIQRLVDEVAARFVPGVLALAALTFVFWWLFGPQPVVRHAMLAGLSVLIIACPCALGLATPTAIIVGTGTAAERGVLFRGSEMLERLHHCDVVVLDKTGTVTHGTPQVVAVEPGAQWLASMGLEDDVEQGRRWLLRLAASVEQASEHPLAGAMVAEAQARGLPLVAIDDFTSRTGLGVEATVEGQRVRVGRPDRDGFVLGGARHGADLEASLMAAAQAGRSALAVRIGDVAAGVVVVSDTVKPTSAQAIGALRQAGLRVLMLTGDSQAAAAAIGAQVGLEAQDIRAEVLPDEKLDVIAALQAEGRVVAMVGDGINDAPALAKADVGVAMGTGSDIAMETAGVTLVRGDLLALLDAREVSRQTLRTIKQNLFFAFVYNVLAIPLAAGALYPLLGVLLSPMVAALAMASSSVSVVMNSLRLRGRAPAVRAPGARAGESAHAGRAA